MIASSDLAHVHALRDTVRPLSIPVGPVDLAGDLGLPPGARGIVVFVDGSGSSRHSPRNQFVAHELHQAGLATLLFDLLTPAEEEHDRFTGELRFNIGFRPTAWATCSRSRGRSVQWRAWRPRGSGTSSPGPSRLTSIPARRLRILRRRKCHDA